jgi:hypothetical protein
LDVQGLQSIPVFADVSIRLPMGAIQIFADWRRHQQGLIFVDIHVQFEYFFAAENYFVE